MDRKANQSTHAGADDLNSPVKKRFKSNPQRSKSDPPVPPRKPKTKFTLAPPTRIPSASSLPRPPSRASLARPRKFIGRTSVAVKAFRSRKSLSMVEMRSPRKTPHVTGDDEYVQQLTDVIERSEQGRSWAAADRYNYFAYKTLYFMVVNVWKKRKAAHAELLEHVKQSQNGTLKAQNQVQVLQTLYRIERSRLDESKAEVAAKAQELVKERGKTERVMRKMEAKDEELNRAILRADHMEFRLEEERQQTKQLQMEIEVVGGKFSAYKSESVEHLNELQSIIDSQDVIIYEGNTELENFRMKMDELHMKQIELKEFQSINAIQTKMIEALSHELLAARLQGTLKYKLRQLLVFPRLSWYTRIFANALFAFICNRELLFI